MKFFTLGLHTMILKKDSDGAPQMLLSTTQIGMTISQSMLTSGNVSKFFLENGGILDAQ